MLNLVTVLAYIVRTEEELDPEHRNFSKPIKLSNYQISEQLVAQPTANEFEDNYFSLEIEETLFSLNASRIDEKNWILFFFIYIEETMMGKFEVPCTHEEIEAIFTNFNSEDELYELLKFGKYDDLLDVFATKYNLEFNYYPLRDDTLSKMRRMSVIAMKAVLLFYFIGMIGFLLYPLLK